MARLDGVLASDLWTAPYTLAESNTAPSQRPSGPVGIGAGEAGSDHSVACSASRFMSDCGIGAVECGTGSHRARSMVNLPSRRDNAASCGLVWLQIDRDR